MIAPVNAAERIRSVDILRGAALLGILLMNIHDFGMPESAYHYPPALNGDTGWNLYFWFVSAIFFDGKMRFLFSVLFGAGTVLLTERAEQRGAGVDTADIYLRRCIWLIVLGMVHSVFIWDGDILTDYGAVGLLLFPFRRLNSGKLFRAAAVAFLLACLSVGANYFFALKTRDEGIAALRIEESKRTKPQTKAASKYQDVLNENDLVKRREKLAEEIQAHQGFYWDVLKLRYPTERFLANDIMNLASILESIFPMLLGMALYRSGVLTASRSKSFYAALTLSGYTLGIPVLLWTTRTIIDSHWDPWVDSLWLVPYEYGRLTVGIGHLAMLLLLIKFGLLRLLANVGQMALTNYLLTSLLMTLFFNGYGLGYYGKLERYQLLYVVAAMWSINLILSTLWLKRFRFGPMEWIWRSLTYWKMQPLRLSTPPSGEPSLPLP